MLDLSKYFDQDTPEENNNNCYKGPLIKPCKRCNSHREQIAVNHTPKLERHRLGGYRIRCRRCNNSTVIIASSAIQAIEDWNRNASNRIY